MQFSLTLSPPPRAPLVLFRPHHHKPISATAKSFQSSASDPPHSPECPQRIWLLAGDWPCHRGGRVPD
ncbi:hypothetical protein TIFTF001_001855 [Ficus carica]|uniref:Uncharacterized protein n=1 Tax=Ficus carica TaxID=3494 RepID=A0AA87Z3E9_FICCA|nr:hypothetical protein TIFTF001_001855 [Ficus carica]